MNYSKQLTRSLLLQKVISIITVLILTRLITYVGSLHTSMSKLLFSLNSVCSYLSYQPDTIAQIFLVLNLPMEPPTKRRKYEASFKQNVIEVVKASSNCAAARTFDVTETMMRDWRKNEDNLRNMPKEKCAMRRGSTR